MFSSGHERVKKIQRQIRHHKGLNRWNCPELNRHAVSPQGLSIIILNIILFPLEYSPFPKRALAWADGGIPLSFRMVQARNRKQKTAQDS